METSKCLRLYKDKEYRAAYYIDKLPEQIFIDMYFTALTNNELNKIQKYELVSKIYNFTKRNVTLNNSEYRIPIKSRNEELNIAIIKPTVIDKENNRDSIPSATLKIVLKFIQKWNI